MKTYAKVLLIVVGVLGMLVLNACVSQKQDNRLAEPAQAPQQHTIVPASEADAEVITRSEGEVSAETTLGFHISGWT